MVKTKILFYDVAKSCVNGINSFTDILFDKTGKEVGTLQVNIFRQNSENVPIFATIVLPNLNINYNYVRSDKRTIITKSTFSSNRKKFIIKREYITETKRKLTIIYDF